jgi:hypothetical protein
VEQETASAVATSKYEDFLIHCNFFHLFSFYNINSLVQKRDKLFIEKKKVMLE